MFRKFDQSYAAQPNRRGLAARNYQTHLKCPPTNPPADGTLMLPIVSAILPRREADKAPPNAATDIVTHETTATPSMPCHEAAPEHKR
jgi:hypothetical protein